MIDWRQVKVGDRVWAAQGSYGWRAGIITELGKQRENRTVAHLTWEHMNKYGVYGHGKRYLYQLEWRNPALKGGDKPRPLAQQVEQH